jgi:intracellular sulfur oxidation DsrE/DsrF family protein
MAKRILVTADTIGRSDTGLGRILMRNFFHSLARSETKPSAVMFGNEGVRLVCEGSEVLDDLSALSEAGVMIRACGTCLEELGIGDEVRIGGIGTMDEMVAGLLADDEIVTIA